MSLEESYIAFQAAPEDKQVLTQVVGHLQPTINYALTTLNAQNDPVLKTNARLIAAEAVKSYDASYGASLNTHVTHNLQKLGRLARKHRAPVHIPERQQLDSYSLAQAEANYADKHGKDPDLVQLSDATGLSVKRIKKVREAGKAVVTEASFEDAGGVETPDYMEDAMDYVHHDADYKDRKVLEHMFGYGGSKLMPANKLAAKLRTHPSQVTRRVARMKLRIHELADALETQ